MDYGGGPLTYWNVDSRMAPDGSLVAAVVSWPGIRIVRELEVQGQAEVAYAKPDCAGFPVAVGAGTLLDRPRFVVSDSECGFWIGNLDDQPSVATPWEELFDPVEPDFNVDVEDVDGDDEGEVLIAGATGFELCRPSVGRACLKHFSTLPYALPGRVLRVAVPVHGVFGLAHAIFFQGEGSSELVPVEPQQLGRPVRLRQQPTEYLRPYVRFDQLAAISSAACDGFAVGIGMFDDLANFPDRRPQVLQPTDDSSFTATTIPTSLDTTTALAVVPREGKAPLVISIGKSGGATEIDVSAFVACAETESLVTAEVEFDWRTPRAPESYTQEYLDHLGVRITAREVEEDVVEAVHFDGFTLRRFEIDLELATVTQRNVQIQ